MRVRIGVVCEGSHDYLFIEPILRRSLTQKGYNQIAIEALQPTIDATSRQIDGGGWAAVEQWCRNNASAVFDSYFDQPLFATSPTYDGILIHLDGDVVEISNKFLPPPILNTVGDRVLFLENWIFSLVDPSARNRASLIPVIPVLHTESWIMAALHPNSPNIEGRPQKDRVKAKLKRRYPGTAARKVELASQDAVERIPTMRQRADSFDRFIELLTNRF